MVYVATSEAQHEHPVIAWIAVLAMLCAIILIAWARFEVHGTHDLEAALSDAPPRTEPSSQAAAGESDPQVEDAVTASRWATGISP
jgi:hypothetical protein